MSPTWNPAGDTFVEETEREPQPEPEQSEFERFESLAAKIANTPKSEIDEKLKKSAKKG
jgi:hypothetical protein